MKRFMACILIVAPLLCMQEEKTSNKIKLIPWNDILFPLDLRTLELFTGKPYQLLLQDAAKSSENALIVALVKSNGTVHSYEGNSFLSYYFKDNRKTDPQTNVPIDDFRLLFLFDEKHDCPPSIAREELEQYECLAYCKDGLIFFSKDQLDEWCKVSNKIKRSYAESREKFDTISIIPLKKIGCADFANLEKTFLEKPDAPHYLSILNAAAHLECHNFLSIAFNPTEKSLKKSVLQEIKSSANVSLTNLLNPDFLAHIKSEFSPPYQTPVHKELFYALQPFFEAALGEYIYNKIKISLPPITALAIKDDGTLATIAFGNGTINALNRLSAPPQLKLRDNALISITPTIINTYSLDTRQKTGKSKGYFLKMYGKNRAITTSVDNTVSLWNIETKEELIKLKGHLTPVIYAKTSKNENIIVTASEDGTSNIWNAHDGSIMYTLENRYPFSCTMNPEKKIIYILSTMGHLITIDLPTSSIEQNQCLLPPETQPFGALKLTADASCLVSAHKNNTLISWNNSGAFKTIHCSPLETEINALKLYEDTHSNALAITLHHKQPLEKSIYISDIKTGNVIMQLNMEKINCLNLTKNYLSVGSKIGEVQQWNMDNVRALHQWVTSACKKLEAGEEIPLYEIAALVAWAQK